MRIWPSVSSCGNSPKAEIKKRVLEAAAILGIEQFLNRRPKALSGGQRQRVAVGRAIVRQPEVFLFDEPLSNLDAKMRVQMRTEIAKLHQRLQATMIYVTHDQIEAMTMGTRIVVMKDGVIQQVDIPLRIYSEPKNLFVAGFLGSPPMNLLKGASTAARAPVVFREAQGGPIEVLLGDRKAAARYIGKEVDPWRSTRELRIGSLGTILLEQPFPSGGGCRRADGRRNLLSPAHGRAPRLSAVVRRERSRPTLAVCSPFRSTRQLRISSIR